MIAPSVLERLPIHDKLEEKVELLLASLGSKVIPLQPFFDELFHLLIVEDQLVNVFKMFARVFICLHSFEKVMDYWSIISMLRTIH